MPMAFDKPAKKLNQVVVASSRYKPEARADAERLIGWFEEAGVSVVHDLEGTENLSELAGEADLVVSVGGDGTILSVARRLAFHQVPTIGVNIGKLGFLAEFTIEDVRAYIDGDPIEWKIVPRMMLRCSVDRKNGDHHTAYALNDVVVSQGVMTRLITIDMHVDDRHATEYRADGLICSTPVGSTAYSLSLGGPILTPGLRAFVITPIAPHALTNRPLVVEGTSKVEFKVRTECDEMALLIDGHQRLDIGVEDKFTVEAAPQDFPLISLGRYSYYDILKAKLHWGTKPVDKI